MPVRKAGSFDGVSVELTYTDVTNYITAWRVVNNNPRGLPARVNLKQPSNGRIRTALVQAGQEHNETITTTTSTRFVQAFDAIRNRFQGLDIDIIVPGV